MTPDADDAADRPAGEQHEADALRHDLERRREIARRQAQDSDQQLRELRSDLNDARRQLGRLRGRRSVLVSVALADRARDGLARARAAAHRVRHPGIGDAVPKAPPPATDAQLELFLDRLHSASSPGEPRRTGPLVSIVTLNRDGATHLSRLLPALATTTYRDLELVVVDNGSRDDSQAILAGFRPDFPVRLISNVDNATFSDGNNQALAVSTGELILFLNNDVEPIDPDWLGYLVDSVLQPGTVAAGARLVYPRRGSAPRAALRFPDLSLQHGGVTFAQTDGVPFPVPMRPGSDALDDWAAAVREAPALTAACLLVRRAALDRVGGFTSGYVYGQEDVDLCLKLRAHGRLVYDGRAILWHHESSTRELGDQAANRDRVRANRDRFVGAWAVRLYRTVMLDALAGGTAWRSEPLRIGLDGGAIPGPRPELDGTGWRVVPLAPADEVDPNLDVLVTSDLERNIRTVPPGPIRVAWIRGPAEQWLATAWLDDFDIVAVDNPASVDAVARATGTAPTVCRDLTAAALAEMLGSWLKATRVGIQTAVPSWDVAESWGDLHFARGLQRALRRLGHPVRVNLLPDAGAWSAARDDVAIHLYGVRDTPTRPGRLEVLWQISHPDRASPELYDRFDQVFVASDGFADWMRRRVRVPVAPLHQATDPERFHPGVGGPAHELLLVANSRGTRRHILADLLPTTHELAVYGRGWTPERLDPRYLAGDGIPNDQLPGYYAAAAIVLNDHWPDMQREGFLSNRLYDVSAAGGFVITDDIAGLEAEFDGGVVAYRDPAELRELIDRFLADPDERRAMADRARAAVLARHTFAQRAEAILEVIGPLLRRRQTVI